MECLCPKHKQHLRVHAVSRVAVSEGCLRTCAMVSLNGTTVCVLGLVPEGIVPSGHAGILDGRLEIVSTDG